MVKTRRITPEELKAVTEKTMERFAPAFKRLAEGEPEKPPTPDDEPMERGSLNP
jgi:hypothetical protein